MSPSAFTPSSALDEETARAELYGLLAQLFYAPAPAPLLASLRVAVTAAPVAGAWLEGPWSALVAAARAQSDAEIQAEYEALFGGIGKPEVLLYASHHLSGFLNEKPLARLRTALAGLGLTRHSAMAETEDHIAYLCEVMRFLIAGDDAGLCNLSQQQRFFAEQIKPWVETLCEHLAGHPRAHFYARLAAFAQAFFHVEAQGFDLLD